MNVWPGLLIAEFTPATGSVFPLVVGILLIAGGIGLALRWLIVRLPLILRQSGIFAKPRVQWVGFVSELQDLVFRDPYVFMSRLCADDGKAFVKRLWVEVGSKMARVKRPAEAADPAMEVRQFRFRDGRAMAVVCLPAPQQAREAYFVGVVLPQDDSLKQDIPRARTAVRYFVLNRFGGPDKTRTTDLCAWTDNRKELTYNVGAPTTPEGFARAVEAKLLELRR